MSLGQIEGITEAPFPWRALTLYGRMTMPVAPSPPPMLVLSPSGQSGRTNFLPTADSQAEGGVTA